MENIGSRQILPNKTRILFYPYCPLSPSGPGDAICTLYLVIYEQHLQSTVPIRDKTHKKKTHTITTILFNML